MTTNPNIQHKPDISKANSCPPLPSNSKTLDKAVYWLGIGLGSGLPKKAPGTWGTIGGMVAAIPLMMLGFIPFLIITIIASVVGIWVCGRTSEIMNVHDDPHIVFDEWAGVWIALLPISFDFTYIHSQLYKNILLSIIIFVLFRFLDIIKPFPIGYLDRKLSGGLGIMLDDLIAGVIPCILLFLLIFYGVV